MTKQTQHIKKVREKSRECHNHKPQPSPDTKRMTQTHEQKELQLEWSEEKTFWRISCWLMFYFYGKYLSLHSLANRFVKDHVVLSLCPFTDTILGSKFDLLYCRSLFRNDFVCKNAGRQLQNFDLISLVQNSGNLPCVCSHLKCYNYSNY